MPNAETKWAHDSTWQIEGHVARLESDNLRAEVNVLDPASGLKILAAEGVIVSGTRIFRVGLPDTAQNSVIDFFARGNDLVAIYSETAEHPFRAQIYWRIVPSAITQSSGRSLDRATRSIAALELILSIQTNLLDADPTLTVETNLAAIQVSQLVDSQTECLTDLHVADSPAVLSPACGLGCFHFRLTDSPLAYTEIVHPADFHRSTLERSAADSNAFRLSHQLFAQRLEKGVILRSRIRGFFTPNDADPGLIALAYQDFATSDPPLTV
jgi:hypothetical protein